MAVFYAFKCAWFPIQSAYGGLCAELEYKFNFTFLYMYSLLAVKLSMIYFIYI